MGQNSITLFTNDSGAAGGPTAFVQDAFSDISLQATNNTGLTSTISTNPLNNLYANDDAPRYGAKTLWIKDLVLLDDRYKWVNGQPTYRVIWTDPYSPAVGYVWGNIQLIRKNQQTYVNIRTPNDGFGVGGVIRRCQFIVESNAAATATGTVQVDGAGSTQVDFSGLNSYSNTLGKVNKMTGPFHATSNETQQLHDFRLKANEAETLQISGVVVYFENSGGNIEFFPGTTYNNKTRAATTVGATLAVPTLGSTLGGTSVLYKQGSGTYAASSISATMLSTAATGSSGTNTVSVSAGHGGTFPTGSGVITGFGSSQYVGFVTGVSTDTLTVSPTLPFAISGPLYRHFQAGQSLAINASLNYLAYSFGAKEIFGQTGGIYNDTLGRYAVWGENMGPTMMDFLTPAMVHSGSTIISGFLQVDGYFSAAEIEWTGMSFAVLSGTMTVNGFGAYSHADIGFTGTVKKTVFNDAGPGWNSFAFFPGSSHINVGVSRVNLYRRNWDTGITFGALSTLDHLQGRAERSVNATFMAPGTYRRYYADMLPFKGASLWERGATTNSAGGIQYMGMTATASLNFQYYGKEFAIVGTAQSMQLSLNGASIGTVFGKVQSVATLGFHTIGVTLLGPSTIISAIDVFRPYGEIRGLQNHAAVPAAVITIPDYTWNPWIPTGTWTANSRYQGVYRVVGDTLECRAKITLLGAPTAADLDINLPTGFNIDTLKLMTPVASVTPLGRGVAVDTGTANYYLTVYYTSTQAVRIRAETANGTYLLTDQSVSETVPFTFGAADSVYVEFKVPISI